MRAGKELVLCGYYCRACFYWCDPDGGTDVNAVLESLLHMHHNRLRGVNRDDEKVCRRIARQAALACLAWTGADG